MMTPKQYLSQLWHINRRIESLRRELERMEVISAVRYDSTHVQGGKEPRPTEALALRQLRIEQRVNSDMLALLDLQAEIHDAIAAVTDPTEQLLLRYRYIECMRWSEITKLMGYEAAQVYRIHGMALLHVHVKDDSK